MNVSRATLLSRKRDLYAALRSLEQDYEDGVVDDQAYRRARHRYELEAAEILQRIDSLPREDFSGGMRRPSPLSVSWRSTRVLVAGAGAIGVAALTLILVTAIHTRSAGTATAAAPTAAVQSSQAVIRAQQNVQAHHRSVTALIVLGNAYVQAGQAAPADQSYRAALKLRPGDPQASTLHAMMIGSTGKYASALRIVHQIERQHPTFARAWLLDGLFAGHTPHGYRESISAWRRFLRLQPRGPASDQVRRLIAATESVAHSRASKK